MTAFALWAGPQPAFASTSAPMELRHLRYFAAVAETLNFSRAAEKVRVAQPALSRQIRQLEEEIGVTLIDRQHSPVRLTDGGRALYEHVTHLLSQLDIAVTAAQQADRGAAGHLMICNDWRLMLGVIPETVQAFRKRFPQVEIDLTELPVSEQLAALREGRIHLGFLPWEFMMNRDEFGHLLVVESELVLVAPTNHVFAEREHVRLVELRHEPWLWIDSPSVQNYRQTQRQVCRLAGFSPQFGRSSSSLPSMLALISSGYGVALLPRCVLPSSHPQLCFVPTDCAPFEVFAVWRQDEPSVPLQRFINTLREQVESPSEGKAR